MKSFLTLLVVVFAISVHAQITIDQNSFPTPNVEYVVSHSNSLDSTLYTASGANQNWDFTGLIPYSQDTVTFLSPNSPSLPITYIVAFNNPLDPDHKATTSSPVEFDQSFPMVTISNVYSFYKLTSSEWIQVGMGAEANGTPLPVRWNPTETILTFPANYGDQSTSNSAFEADIPSLGYINEERVRVNNIDGYGTVTTPYGTFQALKVNSTIYIHDSVYVESMGMSMPIDRKEVEYKWLVNGFKIPIIQVTQKIGMGASTEITYIDSLRDIFIPEMTLQKITTYPNPAEDKLQFKLTQKNFPLIAEVYDQQGRLIMSKMLENTTLNISKLKAGFYSVRLKNDKQIFISKFIKK